MPCNICSSALKQKFSLITQLALGLLLAHCPIGNAFQVPTNLQHRTPIQKRCRLKEQLLPSRRFSAASDSGSARDLENEPLFIAINQTSELLKVAALDKDNEPIVNIDHSLHLSSYQGTSKWQRFRNSLPGRRRGTDTLDHTILQTAIPSMINLAVVPLVNAVDTFWVGRMGIPLALAGQAAANQAFFTIFFLVNYLPTITAPLVASAVGSGNQEEAKQRVCESIFLCNIFGALGTVLLVMFPAIGLSMVLPPGAPAYQYAVPYLQFRGLSMIPSLLSATGFAAFRGMLETVTPLKVSLATNLLNLVLDPILIFSTPLGFVGAALATAVAETASGITYMKLLLKKKLAQLSLILKPPPLSSLVPILQGSLSMLGRQLAINVALVSAARRAQSLDPTGVAAAAYGITMQMYAVGIVVHVAMQGTAAALVPSIQAKAGSETARRMADRIFVWGTIVGLLLALTQLLALPVLVPLFSTVPAVQDALRTPALLVSLLHFVNGPVFAGEGTMLGLGCFRQLMLITAAGVGLMVACLRTRLGQSLEGILLSLMMFCSAQAVAVVIHYLKFGPLARENKRR